MTSKSALNLIDGLWQPADSGRSAPSIDPSNGDMLGSYAASGRIDAEAAITAARRAFDRPQWTQNPRLRQLVMLRWADLMESRGEHLARLLTVENGKPLAQSRGEIAGSVSEIRYYAGLTRYIPGHVFEVEPGSYSTLLKEPAGVAGLIIPWNAPAVLLIRALTPALAAGCTVVIKPAPQTALITAELIKCLHEIDGLAKGVVNLLSEDGSEVAEHLVTSPQVDVVSFTGSNATGQRIMAAAAPTMKKLSLELGGKSACLVFEDVDVADVATKLAAAATIIAGQQCTAARRVLVHASRYDEMKAALMSALGGLKLGSGLAAGTEIGPLIDASALNVVSKQIEDTMAAADEVVLRGGRPKGQLGNGFFLSPTLVAHRDTSAFFVQEEVFGPLVVIEKFEDEKEAVARANHSEYGLSASIWTHDGARAMRVARSLRNGTVWINDHNKLFAEAETGGYRRSGLGRLHGYDALIDFIEIKHIYQNCGIV
ncbi:aldehyde dehydrogenase family protein [Bradyrhizobium sp. AUGA SZCCT0042]|uniref:aldehyde dehydrogenase family protein n=1 Tax=Bradyrhizobium sp. AUGA SZCCT0042 TaxID=2807651 RepID=UPI001BA83493|nr:aldehyde dehydrogenase family protein [Bradyrhizobium sp. AUGA SZCCT0042]MBR1301153.1 aldehyde dehydrogenase family protein [Bradyrhizobium sp. AUGA SZCCT0042]